MFKFSRSTIVALGFACLAAFVFSGCNTLRGLGQDTERAGEEIQEAAR